MSKMETLTINLPVEVVAEVRSAVRDGRYGSDSDAISSALLAWSSRRNDEAEDVEWLREALCAADEHPGPGVPMEEFMDRLAAKYRSLCAEAVDTKPCG